MKFGSISSLLPLGRMSTLFSLLMMVVSVFVRMNVAWKMKQWLVVPEQLLRPSLLQKKEYALRRYVSPHPVGEQLKIVFDLQDDGTAENVYLQGPARIIYIGQVTAEAML